MKIKGYKILNKNFLCKLEKDVNRYIQDGWQPHGNILCDDDTYSQAMIKIDE